MTDDRSPHPGEPWNDTGPGAEGGQQQSWQGGQQGWQPQQQPPPEGWQPQQQPPPQGWQPQQPQGQPQWNDQTQALPSGAGRWQGNQSQGNQSQGNQWPGNQQQWPAGPPYAGRPDQLGPPTAPPRKRRALLVGVLAVVAALGISGGAYAAFGQHKSSAAASNPAVRHIGSDAIAVASINLDPGTDQTVATLKFLRKFPTVARQTGSGGSLSDALLKPLFDNSGQVNYDKDIKPWLGTHAAVAAIAVGTKVHPVLVVESTDDAKARTELATAAGRQGSSERYLVQDGYAYISDSQQVVSRAAATAGKSNISSTFDSAVSGLPGDSPVTIWADAKALVKLAERSNHSGSSIPANVLDNVPDAFAGSLHFNASYADVQLKAIGTHGDLPATKPVGDKVAALPGNTAAAIGVSGLDKGITRLYSTLDTTLGSTFGLGDLTGRIQTQTGLKLPEDLATLLGSQTVLAVDSDLQSVGLSATTDPAKATAVVQRINAQLRGKVALATKQTSDGIIVATSRAYANELGQKGSLGDSAAFKEAVPDTKDAVFVFYTDIGKLRAKAGTRFDGQPDASALSAIGMSGNVSGNSQTLDMRLVVN
ncbi:MAG: DUF3352 domain-containing protein [Mycobacteriales bacterium]